MKRLRVTNELSPLLLIIAAGLAFSGLWRCSPSTSNGSGVGNGMVIGKLYASDGKAPARGALVRVWKKYSHVPITPDGTEQMHAATYITETAEDGTFIIETLDTGLYSIEGVDAEENMARIDSIRIPSSDTRLSLPPATLKAPGALQGSIVLESGGNPKQVFVLCFGNDRYVQSNEDGSFILSPLAEGEYALRLLSLDARYGSIDTGMIKVTSRDTAHLDSIVLPLKAIPAVKGLRVVMYDTMLQIVKLSWNPTPTSITKGYNLYRRLSDTLNFGRPLNGSFLIHDTVFIDTTAFQDSTYEYAAKAVDVNDNEGSMSDSVKATIVPARLFTDSFQVQNVEDYGSLAPVGSKSAHHIYILRDNPLRPYVEKYTYQGQLVKSWHLSDSILGGDKYFIDSKDNLYYQKNDTSTYEATIYQIDTAGAIRKLLAERDDISFFDIADTTIAYFLYSEPSVLKTYRLSTDSIVFMWDWKYLSSSPVYDMSFDSKGNVRLISSTNDGSTIGNTLLTLDKSGATTASFDMPFTGMYVGIYDSILVSNDGSGVFLFYNLKGKLLLKWRPPTYVQGPFVSPGGDIWYGDGPSIKRFRYDQ